MFKNNAVRSCVELHEIALRRFPEHAVVHPMRHRIQLERLAGGGASPARSRRSQS